MTEKPTTLITGATSRVGAAMARDLAHHGWPLVLHTNQSVDQAAALQAEIQGSGGLAAVISADLTRPDELRDVYTIATDAFGPPKIVVNNASIFQDDCLGGLETDLFDAHMAIHSRAPVFLAQAMAAGLPQDLHGLIVNIIDQRVWKPTPQAFSYTLSKAALWTATQTLAQALAPRIRVNGIGPGPSFKNVRQTEADFARQAAAVLLEHGPDRADFGRTIRYLWDTKSITGQMIALDGGQHLAWQTPDVIGVGE